MSGLCKKKEKSSSLYWLSKTAMGDYIHILQAVISLVARRTRRRARPVLVPLHGRNINVSVQ